MALQLSLASVYILMGFKECTIITSGSQMLIFLSSYYVVTRNMTTCRDGGLDIYFSSNTF